MMTIIYFQIQALCLTLFLKNKYSLSTISNISAAPLVTRCRSRLEQSRVCTVAVTPIDMVFSSSGDVQDNELDSWTTLMNLPHCNWTWSNEIKTPFFSGLNLQDVYTWMVDFLCAITALFIPQDSCCGQGSSHTSIFEPTGDVHWPCWWVSICWYLNKTLKSCTTEFY